MDSSSYHKQKMEILQAELERIRRENETLKYMFEIMVNKFSVLRANVQETKSRQVAAKFDRSKYLFYDDDVQYHSNKRARTHQEFPITKQSGPSQIFVRTDCKDNNLIVKDGYQWRKYGQKVTKDNPSPRAYFRCSMSPACPVKKKVQRCVEDKSLLVATYEGEHNHEPSSISPRRTLCSPDSTSRSSIISSTSSDQLTTKPFNNSTTTALDLTLSTSSGDGDQPSIEEYCKKNCNMIEQYMASLAKDPNFTLALAEAVARTLP